MMGRAATMLMMLALAGIALLGGGRPEAADAVYHSQHIPLTPLADQPLRSGFVENIHADGPNVYAHEEYVVNGAEPNTSYQVTLMVFPLDTTCSRTPLVIPTATIQTNAAGNGTAYHVFTPADADGLRGLTVGGMWVVMSGSTVAYETSCTTIHLD